MKYSKNYGRRIIKFMLLFAVTMSLSVACDEGCNDCIDLTSKNILVTDPSGNNLLFGNQAIYDPESIFIRYADGEIQPLFIDESSNTLQFF